jgi:hypothetical protein
MSLSTCAPQVKYALYLAGGIGGVAAVLLANRALAAGRSTVLAQIVLLLTVLDVLATIGLTIYLMTLDLGYDWWTILLNVLVRCKGMRHGGTAGCGPGFGMSATHACPLLLAVAAPSPQPAPAPLVTFNSFCLQMLIQRTLYFAVASMALWTLREAHSDETVAAHVAQGQGYAAPAKDEAFMSKV